MFSAWSEFVCKCCIYRTDNQQEMISHFVTYHPSIQDQVNNYYVEYIEYASSLCSCSLCYKLLSHPDDAIAHIKMPTLCRGVSPLHCKHCKQEHMNIESRIQHELKAECRRPQPPA